MKTTKISFKTRFLRHALFQNVLVKLLFIVTLSIIQFPVQALQLESMAMRNMNTYKKFNGVSQTALVIKSKIDRSKYFDRIEFASGELGNDVENSFFVSAGPSWRFNKRIVGSGLAFLELGTSPTWIEDGDFGDESLGGHVFFTSNVQLGMHFGYRRELTLFS